MRKQKNYRCEKVRNTAHEHTMESQFFEPQMETKISEKNRRVREIGDKGIVFERGEENDFRFKLSRGLKKRGFEKLRFQCSLIVNKQHAVL